MRFLLSFPSSIQTDSFLPCSLPHHVPTPLRSYRPLPSQRCHSLQGHSRSSSFPSPFPPSAHLPLHPQGHASSTSHPPELVLNHFQTPLGLSLATLLSQLFLPPQTAAKLASQGFIGRQVVLAQNSRDFVFIRRYRYMFALRSHRLGKTKKQSDIARITDDNSGQAEGFEDDDTVKTRFQEIGPQMTLKMRWIRRGPLGETGDERKARERFEAETGEVAAEFGEQQAGGEMGSKAAAQEGMEVDGDDEDDETAFDDDEELNGEEGASDEGEEDEATAAADEEAARREIGLDASDAAGQPLFAPTPSTSTADPSAPPAPTPSKKRPRTVPRKRTKPTHPLYNPARSPTPESGEEDQFEAVPLPRTKGGKKNKELDSQLGTVGKTWHAGKGEGGVREGAKRREWNWEVRFFPPSLSRRLLVHRLTVS